MKKEYCCGLDDLLNLFDETLSASDILAAKALAEVSGSIVSRRMEMGMTQKEFSKYLGVSQSMVSKWESTDYNFTVKALADIAAKLDLDLTVRLRKPYEVKVSHNVKTLWKTAAAENTAFCDAGYLNARPFFKFCVNYQDFSSPLTATAK